MDPCCRLRSKHCRICATLYSGDDFTQQVIQITIPRNQSQSVPDFHRVFGDHRLPIPLLHLPTVRVHLIPEGGTRPELVSILHIRDIDRTLLHVLHGECVHAIDRLGN